ncbi:MAG: Dabb family protein [Acidobacteria bacterium]|nr:Dabb family protein [Acidobacteriota bacterium]
MLNVPAHKTARLAAGMLLFLAGCVAGRMSAESQKTLMHVFAYTPLEESTPQDFEDFKTATTAMVDQIPGLRRVWVGKLREPLPVETRIHTYGVAMEFDNTEALDAYAIHPAHDAWIGVYDKVRLQGTTTLDILGE